MCQTYLTARKKCHITDKGTDIKNYAKIKNTYITKKLLNYTVHVQLKLHKT